MATYDVTVTQSLRVGDRSIQTQKEYQGGVWKPHKVLVPDATTDQQVELAIDVSEVKNLLLYSTRDLKVETNNPTTPADTINLKGGVPLVWNEHAYFSNPLGTDVTDLYLTNTSGYDAVFEIEVLET